VRNIATASGKTPPPPGGGTPPPVRTPPSAVDVPTADEEPPGGLAFTGSNTVPYVATGLLLLMVGLALVLVARRRRDHEAA
jgi:LPXTG-motif cell wall-anchored protein